MKRRYARAITEEERQELRKGLKSPLSVRLKRSQMILWSADEGLAIAEIAQRLAMSQEAVRQVLHRFHEEGVAALYPKVRARHTDQRAFNDEGRVALREILNHSPREVGYARSFWTLELLARWGWEKGWTKQQVHLDTISQTLREMGIKWRRSKAWISSPDDAYEVKKRRDWLKKQGEKHSQWWVLDEDECWFSRLQHQKCINGQGKRKFVCQPMIHARGKSLPFPVMVYAVPSANKSISAFSRDSR